MPFLSLADGAPEANGSGGELLDAEADAFLLGIGVQHHGLDSVALLVILERFLAGLGPVQVGQMHHAVDAAVEADEQAELGDVADLALDDACRADWLAANAVHGFSWVCLRPSEMRRLSGSTSSTWTSTSWLVETILPGWMFFLVQLISETWIRPSTPGSSSTKAP